MKTGPRHRTLTFMVILALTTLVWLAVAMSEPREYSLAVKVEMTGFDKSRHVVLSADSAVTIQVQSSGFNALLFSLKKEPLVLEINMNGENVRQFVRHDGKKQLLCRSVSVDDLGESLVGKLSELGMQQVGSLKDSLRLVLSERSSKILPVDIGNVKTSFAEGYGLYGEPSVTPSQITLFGDEEVLSKIDKVSVMPTNINSLTQSGTFNLMLDTSWRAADVYASTDKVTLTVPVDQYVEREYTLPITVTGLDSLIRMNLYPDKVTLKVWVPRRDIATVTADRFEVAVDYADATPRSSMLTPRLVRFPQTVRIHTLAPDQVKYVVIK